ncbi:MAG: 23S rRNA (uracil(1939)-C(5))-methyltransferase RlmD [Lachnospiraceae bacterium]|nr:23S rRNA (uracil(1939)-C(5))-methyltransferase RlmD [Lachnospiraceae bacterium]
MISYVKNQETEIVITDLGSEGEGIGKIDGFPFFVKGALPGDRILAGVTKVKKNYAFARVIKILEPSADRVSPKCEADRRCGGCRLQSLSYDAQLRYKTDKVKNILMRIGGVPEALLDKVMEPIIGMGENAEGPWRYRNKAQYPFGRDKEGKLVYGFYAGRTHDIITCDDCLISAPENGKVLENIVAWMNEHDLDPYDESNGTGLLRHVLIRKSRAYNELMVCLVINAKDLPWEKELVDKLTHCDEIASISYSVNMDNTNVIMGREYHTVYGKDTIKDRIGGLEFNISPLSFYQVNPVQTEKLYSTALEFADLKGDEVVWDLYCGIGTISLFLAKHAKKVCGVEIVPQAIDDAKNNAKENGISNAEFYVGAAEEILPAYYENNSDDMTHPDVVVVDPPRKGLDEKCIETIVKMTPERVVYVSCDPATLARDIRIFAENGYVLKRVRACDMFPQTVHVETVVLLIRKK